MSLPIVMIFERHWDVIPKLVVRDLLPRLVERGYEILCFEAPQDISSAEIINRHNAGLEFDSHLQEQAEKLLKQVGITRKLSDMSFNDLAQLMRLYVSSKKYLDLAEKFKQLPASCVLKTIFYDAKKLSVRLKGIDINDAEFNGIVKNDLTSRMSSIKLNEDTRIATIFGNLLKLRDQQEKGIILMCGSLHAGGLLSKFKEKNMENEVLYYFPHSSSRYDDSVDDIHEIMTNEDSVGHMHLLTEQDVKSFSTRIIKEVVAKAMHMTEMLHVSHSSESLEMVRQDTIKNILAQRVLTFL